MRLPFTALTTAAAIAVLGLVAPVTSHAGPVDVNINLSGYLPTPPGVHIYFDAGRPYYVENHKRVYVKKKEKDEHHDHGKKKGHKKHHKDRD